MIKRLILVLLIAVGVVFVPYPTGNWFFHLLFTDKEIHCTKEPILSILTYLTGICITRLAIGAIVIIKRGSKPLINWIKTGK